MSDRAVLTAVLMYTCLATHPSSGFAQNPHPQGAAVAASTKGQAAEQATSNGGNAEQRSWLVRDPTTGRLYQQELVTRTVATTQWEVRPVPTTVYEPKQIVTTVPRQQVTYTPATQYVMQPRVKGWWNPLKQPVQAYEFVPVTSWQPQTQTVQQPVTTTQWVAKQQMVYLPQAVQRNQTQQQIVSREIPQPSGSYPPGGLPATTRSAATMMAAQRNPMLTRPLFANPLLARQSGTSWNNTAWPTNVSNPITSSGTSSGGFNNGLRPIANALAPTYSPALQTASSASSPVARDPTQSGMSATVLR